MTQILYACGAVPFVMTNVPQTLVVLAAIPCDERSVTDFLFSQWPEAYNLVFGRTLNPANRMLTSGGSSGGEGALIGMKGSPLGIGSDLGGYAILSNPDPFHLH